MKGNSFSGHLLFITAFSLNLLLSQPLVIPLATNLTRCMMIYTSSADDTVKVQVVFPKLSNQNQNQNYYLVSLHNTQLYEIDYQKVNAGSYRKQLKLSPHVIYQICFKIVSISFQKVQISYQDRHQFRMFNPNQDVPAALLKSDLQTVYRDILLVQDISLKQIQMYSQRRQYEKISFEYIQETDYLLIALQLVSIIFLILMGAIQFYIIRQHLVDSMYI